jgi:hypothetical protein
LKTEPKDRPVLLALLAVVLSLWLTSVFPLSILTHTPSATGHSSDASTAEAQQLQAEVRLADYTFWLTIFTGLLAGVAAFQVYFLFRTDRTAAVTAEIARKQMAISGQQTDILERQKEILRQEFIATHRPRLRMRLLRIEKPELGKPIVVQYEVVNVGETNAQIVDNTVTIRIDGFETPKYPGDPPKPAQFNFTRQIFFANDLRQGEALLARGEITNFDAAWGFNGIGEWWVNRLFVIGMIRYMDNNGVLRRTRFYRVATRDLNRFVYPEFEAATAADHEYED